MLAKDLISKTAFNGFFAVFLLVSTCCAVNAQNPKPFVIPSLLEWKGGNGELKIPRKVAIVLSHRTSPVFSKMLERFVSDLHDLDSRFDPILSRGTPENGCFYFDIDSNQTVSDSEAYHLQTDNYVTITATNAKGAFWATRTILQILSQQADHNRLPKGYAYDKPMYEVRGFVLDVGRKFFTIDFLKTYVRFMSYYKMNDFHIHLNDNGFKKFFNNDWTQTYSAFRLENDQYPGLTATDGSYSKAEFIDLQKFAQSYGVNIIPEIDVPAHALALVKAVPEIGSLKYGLDHLDIHNPLTYTVVDNIFREYLAGPDPVFIGEEVHIGTDEYAKSEAETFRAFTDHYIRLVEGYGKKVRMWGALTHAAGQTAVKAQNVTMNLWYNGYADPAAMFKLGYKGISSPDGWLYIVPAAGYYYDYLDNQKIYNEWAPNRIGNQTFDVNAPQIRGGAFAVWNDHPGNGITEKDVHDRVFRSMQVLSQKMWSANHTNLPFAEFAQRSAKMGEGPGLNFAGKVGGRSNLVLSYPLHRQEVKDASGNKRHSLSSVNIRPSQERGNENSMHFAGNSYITSPLTEIGYDYTVSFSLKPDSNNRPDAVLFSSPNASVKLLQGNTGQLGFSREGYDYHFNYLVPLNTWTNIVITGNNKGTSLFVNGVFKERLEGNMKSFSTTKDKNAIIQTLVFPLKYIGDHANGFTGEMKKLSVYNRVLSDIEINKISR